MRITLIYTDCAGKKSGDYAAAGDIAYTLQSYLDTASVTGNICMLASSQGGVEKFKSLYGNPASSTLNIHGVSIETVVLADFVRSPQKQFVVNYVEIANCKPADSNLVKQLLNPSTTMLFIGLPHNPTTPFYTYYYFHYGALQQPSSVIFTGVASGREGIPIYNGPFFLLDHPMYQHVTQGDYGFIYYNDRKDDESQLFVRDYLRVADTAFSPTSYVIIGGAEYALNGVADFCISKRKKAIVHDVKNSKISCIEYDSSKGLLSKQTYSTTSTLPAYDATTIKVVILSGVPHDQMRSLMNSAIRFIGTTGVTSMAEAMAFGKVTLHQFLMTNNVFISDTRQSVLNKMSASSTVNITRVLNLLSWKQKLNAAEVKELVVALNDNTFCTELTKTNIDLIADCRLLPALKSKLNIQPEVAPASVAVLTQLSVFTAATTTPAQQLPLHRMGSGKHQSS